jgi:hypothetical protein
MIGANVTWAAFNETASWRLIIGAAEESSALSCLEARIYWLQGIFLITPFLRKRNVYFGTIGEFCSNAGAKQKVSIRNGR